MTTNTRGSSLEHRIGSDGLFSIRMQDGEIRLRGADTDSIRIRDRGDRSLDESFSVELGAGSIALKSGGRFSFRGSKGGSADLDIELPRGATIVVEGGSTEIAAEGLLGDQRYRTASGDVRLRGVGGRVAIDAVSGDVAMESTGDVALAVRTVSGDVDVRAGTFSAMEVATTSGDVSLIGRMSGAGPFSVMTVSGDAQLTPLGDVRIQMATLSGDLHSSVDGRSEGGPGRRSLTLGKDGPLVSVRTMSGDLIVNAAGADHTGPLEPPGPSRIGRPEKPPTAGEPRPDDAERATVEILQALERGEIDVVEAARRLEGLGEPVRAPQVDPATDTTRYSHEEQTHA